jgi:hypothetical protein
MEVSSPEVGANVGNLFSSASIEMILQYKRDAKSECQVSVNSTGILFTYL